MTKLIEIIKNQPIIAILGGFVAALGAIVTTIDFRDKVCEEISSYLKPAMVEERIGNIWTDLTKADVTKMYGTPVLVRTINLEDLWIYKSTNSYLAIGFSNDGIVNQFIIAVSENSLDNFVGYQLHDSDVYGKFVLGKSSMEGAEFVEAGVGAQTGYVIAVIDPPYIARKGGFWNSIYIKSFDTHIFNRTKFGSSVLNAELSDAINFCELPECTKKDADKARHEVLASIPGWLHIYKDKPEKFDDEWLIEQFSIVEEKQIEYGGILLDYCANLN